MPESLSSSYTIINTIEDNLLFINMTIIQYFVEAGIDEEVFKEIDDKLINDLFEKYECGYKKKFVNKFESLKENNFELEFTHIVPPLLIPIPDTPLTTSPRNLQSNSTPTTTHNAILTSRRPASPL